MSAEHNNCNLHEADDERRRFAERMIAELRASGEQRPMRYKEETFMIEVGDAGDRLNLRNFYDEFQLRADDDRETVFSSGAAMWNEGLQLKEPVAFEQVEAHLRLQLMPRVVLDGELAMPGRPDEPLLSDDWLGEHLSARLVLDSPNALSDVTASQLEHWSITLPQAISIARRNLAGAGDRFLHDRRRGLYLSQCNDHYDAARITIPEMLRQMPLRGDPVVLAPNYTSLIVAGSSDREALRHMAQVGEQMLDQPKFIGAVPLVLVGERQWEVFEPASHVSAKARRVFEHLRLRTVQLRYQRQHWPLRRALDAGGRENVFISSCNLFSAPGTGEADAIACWCSDLRQALPKSGWVAFSDPCPSLWRSRFFGLAPWERVQAILGHLMVPLGTDPRRYLIDTFPTESQLRALELVDKDGRAAIEPKVLELNPQEMELVKRLALASVQDPRMEAAAAFAAVGGHLHVRRRCAATTESKMTPERIVNGEWSRWRKASPGSVERWMQVRRPRLGVFIAEQTESKMTGTHDTPEITAGCKTENILLTVDRIMELRTGNGSHNSLILEALKVPCPTTKGWINRLASQQRCIPLTEWQRLVSIRNQLTEASEQRKARRRARVTPTVTVEVTTGQWGYLVAVGIPENIIRRLTQQTTCELIDLLKRIGI